MAIFAGAFRNPGPMVEYFDTVKRSADYVNFMDKRGADYVNFMDKRSADYVNFMD